jgi:hypothetical protein
MKSNRVYDNREARDAAFAPDDAGSTIRPLEVRILRRSTRCGTPYSCRCDIGVVATIEKITAAEKINTSHAGRFCG